MKKTANSISNDEVRQKILSYLNSVRNSARSLTSMAVKITDIKKALKEDDIKQNDVVRNLDYLVQNHWIEEIIEKKLFKTLKGFEVPTEKRTYKLSELGIKYFEDSSFFDNTQNFSGINITNINGVTVVGSNNVVQNEFVPLYKNLDRLDNLMKMTSNLTDEQKLSLHSDIETAKEQLSKANPDKSILRTLLDGLMVLSSIPGLIDVFNTVKIGIESILK